MDNTITDLRQIISRLKRQISIQDRENNQLRHQAEQLTDILSMLPGNIYWLDKDGVCLGCNNNLIHIMKLKNKDEIIGKKPYEFMPPDIAKATKENNDAVLQSGNDVIFEEHGINKNNAPAIYLTRKKPLKDRDGNTTGLLGVSLDITEHKQLEKDIRDVKTKEQMLEKQVQAMKTVSATIAHELRTPLRTISNSANIKKYMPTLISAYKRTKHTEASIEKITPAKLESIPKALNNISHEVEYANSFIDMLLTSIKELEVGTDTLEACSISKCINEALERYPFSTKAEQDLIKWDDKNKDDFIFLGQELSTIHILFNLIKNALYFIAKANKGSISIWLKHNANYNTLHFKDTGYGIPPGELPHIFNHFMTTTPNGTGIGLTFCKTAMENIGGNIACSSSAGEYTEFILNFPKTTK